MLSGVVFVTVFLTGKTMKKTFSRLALMASFAAMSVGSAMAAGNPLTDAIDSVDLTGIAVKIAAAGLLIVGVALAFKGPDLAKRVTRKI